MATATFGAGCFWGIEEAFRQMRGVTGTAVGYSGGTTASPSYEEVCSGRTGHAEVVQVDYDPAQVSYDALLDVFWASHDPTTPNRQGPDVGTQYRSVIFYHTSEQRDAAERSRTRASDSGRYAQPIVTEVIAAPPFFRAEEYHQRHFAKRGIRHCPSG